MPKTKLALKRLTASDLTLFEWQFRNRPAGNQKAINLNRNVFIDILYPALPEVAEDHDGRLPLDVTIYGPGGKTGLNLQRKIIKFGTYKNWRLNGEFIYNPQSDPQRFNQLRPDDLALFEFSGGVVPAAAKIFLISTHHTEDVSLHQALDELLGEDKMMSLTQDQLKQLVNSATISQEHPLRLLAIDEILEDAAQGGITSLERLWAGVARQKLSHEALQRARRNAENVGQIGEEFVNAHLNRIRQAGDIEEYEWTSVDNAVAPYDFKVKEKGTDILLDVKATAGDFTRNIHISMNELRQMANGAERYDLWRVYMISGTEAKLRIANEMRAFARTVLDALKQLPQGVNPDGFSVDPDTLPFGKEMLIMGPEEDD